MSFGAVAAITSVVGSVKSISDANKAQKKQKSELEKNQRIAQVDEITQVTLNSLGGQINSPEFQEFFDFTVKNPDDVQGAQEKSKNVIAKYNERNKKDTVTMAEQKSNNTTVSGLDLPLLQATLSEISLLKNRLQTVPDIPPANQENKQSNNNLIFGVIGAIILLLILRKGKI